MKRVDPDDVETNWRPSRAPCPYCDREHSIWAFTDGRTCGCGAQLSLAAE